MTQFFNNSWIILTWARRFLLF